MLITGGFTTGFLVVASVDLYDPGLGTITPMAEMSEPRASHTGTLLPSGDVLVAGGFSTGGPTDTAELFDTGMGTWTATGSLGESREATSADFLGDGAVLIAAG